MFFSSIIINEYDSIVKRENEYFSIFVSVAQFYCELSMTQALFFVQADQICGRLAAVLTAARTACAWAPSLLLRVVSSACPAAVRPSRSARPAARPAVLPCPGPAVPLLLRSARPALLRQSGGQPSALPAASKKLRHPQPVPVPVLAGGSAPAGCPAHGRREDLTRQAVRTWAQCRRPGQAGGQGKAGGNVVTTTFSYTDGNFPGSGGRSSAEKPLQVVPAPPPVLGCPASAASALQAWRRRLLVRSTAIKYTKKPPRADCRRRRLFMADFSGSGTGSGALTGSGCGGSWSGTRLGGFRHRHPPAGLPLPAPENAKRDKSKKTKPLCRKEAKRSGISRTGLGCNGWKLGKKWNTVFRPKLKNFGSQGKS